MKVSQPKPKFEQITITLETEEDVERFLNILELSAEAARARLGLPHLDLSLCVKRNTVVKTALDTANDLHNRVLNPQSSVLND